MIDSGIIYMALLVILCIVAFLILLVIINSLDNE